MNARKIETKYDLLNIMTTPQWLENARRKALKIPTSGPSTPLNNCCAESRKE
jgi:hypothetical protein